MQLKHFINRKNIKKYQLLTHLIEQEYQKILLEPTINIADSLLTLRNNKNLSEKKKIIQSIALAKLASKTVLGMTYYDVQLMGALALVDGCIAEMKTGEGKTLTCSAAVAANYVLGYQTHVATANEYLASRDEQTLTSLYKHMGISSSSITSDMSKEQKKAAYECSVVYSTAQELGFDFLRDNLIYHLNEKIQPLNFLTTKCIIDEADFILIDEARTPLIISGESPLKDNHTYQVMKELINKLVKMPKNPEGKGIEEDHQIPGDYWLDEKYKSAYLSDKGYAHLEKLSLEAGLLLPAKHSAKLSLYQNENSWIIHEILNALRAKYLYIKDKDYILHNNEIVIIDQNTGRLSHGRTWSNGLHQAIEAKENIAINPESMTLGSISIQNYFRTYCQISGMSGTIMESSEEFEQIYSCKTLQIPTNRNMIRKDHQDHIYLSVEAKYQALVQEVLERHKKAQPVLLGTTSVAESEIISQLLTKHEISHHVLNAKNNALEAQIIAQAGQPYSVTVATSMAGRGTDIILGGNREILTHILDQQLLQIEDRMSQASLLMEHIHGLSEFSINVDPLTPNDNTRPDTFQTSKNQEIIDAYFNGDYLFQEITNNYPQVWNTLFHLKMIIDKQKELLENQWNDWRTQVLKAGGLCVIGSSRNESRRIDDQLRGRAGRQGDPGESIFYLSTKDSWVSVFGSNPIFNHLAKTMPANQAISAPSISKAFAKIQRQIEGHHFESRKNTYQYDSIADEGRKRFLQLRSSLLLNNNATKEILLERLYSSLLPLISDDFLIDYEDKHSLKTNEINTLLNLLKTDTAIDLLQYIELFLEEHHYANLKEYKHDREIILQDYVQNLLSQYNHHMWTALTSTILYEIDKLWTDHLLFIDDAQKNVGFSSLAQKNPLYEYKKICFDSFASMLNEFKTKLQLEFFSLAFEAIKEIKTVPENTGHKLITHIHEQKEKLNFSEMLG